MLDNNKIDYNGRLYPFTKDTLSKLLKAGITITKVIHGIVDTYTQDGLYITVENDTVSITPKYNENEPINILDDNGIPHMKLFGHEVCFRYAVTLTNYSRRAISGYVNDKPTYTEEYLIVVDKLDSTALWFVEGKVCDNNGNEIKEMYYHEQ